MWVPWKSGEYQWVMKNINDGLLPLDTVTLGCKRKQAQVHVRENQFKKAANQADQLQVWSLAA